MINLKINKCINVFLNLNNNFILKDGNGAFINGEMVKKDTVLLENDLISFGCRGLNIYNATDEFLYKLSYVENSTDMTEIVSNDENEVPDLKQNKTHIRILTARLLKVYNQTAASK